MQIGSANIGVTSLKSVELGVESMSRAFEAGPQPEPFGSLSMEIDALGSAEFGALLAKEVLAAVPAKFMSAFYMDSTGFIRFLFAEGDADQAQTLWNQLSSKADVGTPFQSAFFETVAGPSNLRLRPWTTGADRVDNADPLSNGFFVFRSFKEDAVVLALHCSDNGVSIMQEYSSYFERMGGVILGLIRQHVHLIDARSALLFKPVFKDLVAQMNAVLPQLSIREVEVCASMLLNMSIKEIALRLGVAPTSVETFRKRAYLKLGVGSRVEFLKLYERLLYTNIRRRGRFSPAHSGLPGSAEGFLVTD
ncbi:LuxR C-terminal-related transcriptional regulator [Caulobacter sp. S45]|uniref:LuxR C-terminal-related transcriptional regulator n=1 Tax=Caulobacter sp. S45 TaxID=1641861 RepID=UPI00131A7ECF|nr:LuxR C-terminal-related transcriptional regulator [Caulobacter sp. S45]